jgi:arylsulfatase A-like enzyme
MRRLIASTLLGLALSGAADAEAPSRNVVLFVADGLRAGMVNAANAPTMDRLMKAGVRFTNTHALFPTFTMPNATAMATGHLLGDTGQFGNTIYTAFPVPGAGDSLTPFLESDPVLGDVDAHFAGNYLNEETVLRAAHAKGLSTASIGKLGPSLVFDHTARSGQDTILVDDSTGRPGGVPLSDALRARLSEARLPDQAPTRGPNGRAGTAEAPATMTANVEQQRYFADVATRAVLPLFKARGNPFVMVFWSRDPDGTQHNQGDSLGHLVPGINGPTSLAAIRNADDNLAALLAALKEQGLADSTDVVLTSDHGFSTISKESATSVTATRRYKGVPDRQLPPGFVAIDLAHDLGLGLFDPDAKGANLGPDSFPSRANGLIGTDPASPDVVVAANGGSDLVYLPSGDRDLARKVVEALARQDYVSGLFVSDTLSPIPGTLPLSSIALDGSALTPMPAIVVNFRSFSTGCVDPTTCGVEVADTVLQQGQGMHGSFSRADTRNVMGAMGPSFRAGIASSVPASNADLGQTVARILDLSIPAKGRLVGRVLTESLANGATPKVEAQTLRSAPDAAGRVTLLRYQTVEGTRYFDAAGYPGRTLGLTEATQSAAAEPR